ncbi:Transcription factor iws1 [Cyanidiococcus yangmingshanensis]|uniref:Transcription factor iws1 n=1 Tax=Cyanidiococcus yangmingshanensis TaxID=2690220 RepID=A0A7J7ICR0_9RHOD|nr:Transcription factor iws1 [Cyanidiococcus yangmingshanensis]
MRSAYDADLIMARLGRPALAKLRLLRQVDTELRRKETRVALIRRGLFEVLRRWLDPLPNGALPSIDVRSTLMDILLTFRTSVSDSEDELEDEETANELQRSLARRAGAREWERALLNSGIGRCIHFYKLYDPDPECRLKAERLVMRWASAVLRSDTSYRNALSKRFEVVPAHRDTRAPSGQGTIGAGQVPEPYHSGAGARAAKETSGSVSVTSKISAQTPVILSASLPERPPTDWTRIPQVEQLPAVPRTRSAREKQMSKHLKRIRDTV